MKTLTILTIIIASVFMIAPVFGQVYPDGMVSYWKFDEDSGTIATDSVGTNDGTLVNGPVWTAGQVDGALSFDGVDDYVSVPDSDDWYFGTGDFTIDLWVRFNSLPTTPAEKAIQMFVGQKEDGDNYLQFCLDGRDFNKNIFYIAHVGGVRKATYYSEEPSFAFVINTWYHIALVRSGSNIYIFRDGVSLTLTESEPIGNSDTGNIAAPLSIGRWLNSPYTFCVNGLIDEVAIYNQALSPEEIQQHYQNGLNGLGYEGESPCIYVDEDATGANDGSSWENAFNYLQDALAVAVSGDEIWVAQGTYKPDKDTVNPGGTSDRLATFQLKIGVAVYGGFAGTETSVDQRNWQTNETILNGDLNGDDVGFTNNGENSYHVVTGSGTDGTAVLDGLTITAGNANLSSGIYHDSGGGMLNEGGSPTVINCNISGNSAIYAAMFNYIYSNPTVTNCTFSGNSGVIGGGMNNWKSSNATVTNCRFIGNSADVYGGGIINDDNCSSTVTNCIFIDNSANNGGGMYNYKNSNPTVTNCIFSGNSANRGGGMENSTSGNPTVTNCTFSGNTAETEGGGVYNYNHSSPTVTNCILWANTAPSGAQIYNDGSSSVTLTYSDVEGGWTGTGNINEDPCFVDLATADYHLLPGSPCIDGGDDSAVPPDVNEDLDGNPRIFRATVDMGAYEYQNTPPVANAGGPYIEYATSWFGANVELNGTNSNDPDGDAITYEWDLDLSLDSDQDGDPCNDVDATDPAPESFFSIGQTDIALVVIDEHGLRSERDTTNVTVSFIEVAIDIKPGSFPNAINMGSNGVVPVAFLTDWGFDASTVDPATVTLRGEDFADGLVKLRGKKDAPVPMANLEDVDGDGDLDLVVHLETEKLAEYELEAICQIGALTYEGYVVSGSDTIQIVPE